MLAVGTWRRLHTYIHVHRAGWTCVEQFAAVRQTLLCSTQCTLAIIAREYTRSPGKPALHQCTEHEWISSWQHTPCIYIRCTTVSLEHGCIAAALFFIAEVSLNCAGVRVSHTEAPLLFMHHSKNNNFSKMTHN